MEDTTEVQQDWRAAFNQRVMSIVAYTESADFHDAKADNLRRKRGETEESAGQRRAAHRTRSNEMREKRRQKEDEFTAWVIANPYPTSG